MSRIINFEVLVGYEFSTFLQITWVVVLISNFFLELVLLAQNQFPNILAPLLLVVVHFSIGAVFFECEGFIQMNEAKCRVFRFLDINFVLQ